MYDCNVQYCRQPALLKSPVTMFPRFMNVTPARRRSSPNRKKIKKYFEPLDVFPAALMLKQEDCAPTKIEEQNARYCSLKIFIPSFPLTLRFHIRDSFVR